MRRPLAPLPRRNADGFTLMWYAAQDGTHRERIWNSRDAVTPFCVGSRDNSTEITHVDWHLDEFAPSYVPRIGERVFVNLTPELARPIAQAYVEKYWNHPEHPMGEMFGEQGQTRTREHFVLEWCSSFGGESPHLITVDEAWQAIFRERATVTLALLQEASDR